MPFVILLVGTALAIYNLPLLCLLVAAFGLVQWEQEWRTRTDR